MSRFVFTFCFLQTFSFHFLTFFLLCFTFYVLTNICFILECALNGMYKSKLLLLLLLLLLVPMTCCCYYYYMCYKLFVKIKYIDINAFHFLTFFLLCFTFYVLTNICFILECALNGMYKNKLLLLLLLLLLVLMTCCCCYYYMCYKLFVKIKYIEINAKMSISAWLLVSRCLSYDKCQC